MQHSAGLSPSLAMAHQAPSETRRTAVSWCWCASGALLATALDALCPGAGAASRSAVHTAAATALECGWVLCVTPICKSRSSVLFDMLHAALCPQLQPAFVQKALVVLSGLFTHIPLPVRRSSTENPKPFCSNDLRLEQARIVQTASAISLAPGSSCHCTRTKKVPKRLQGNPIPSFCGAASEN